MERRDARSGGPYSHELTVFAAECHALLPTEQASGNEDACVWTGSFFTPGLALMLAKVRLILGRLRNSIADLWHGLPAGEPFELERLPFSYRKQLTPAADQLVFAPRDDVDPVPLMLPMDWDADPYQDRNWRAQLHMWRAIDSHLIAYSQSHDLAWLRLPVALMLDWWQWHGRRIEGGRSSRYAWADLVNGNRATKIAYILGVERDRRFLTAWQRLRLLELARAHVVHITAIEPLRYSNHMFDDLMGVAALRTQLGPQVGAQITAFLDRELPRLLALQYTEKGVHRENSPGYQRFANSKLRELMRTGWFETPQLERILAKGEIVESWFRMPNGSIAPVGDTDGRKNKRVGRTKEKRCGVFNSDGYVVDRHATRPDKPPSSYFLHMAAYHSWNHKHNDDLSYIWYDQEDILCDVGKYAYKDDVWAEYAKSAQAHNTIQIDNLSFHPRTMRESRATGVYGSAVRHVRRFEQDLVISSAADHAIMGVRHVRTLVYRPASFVLCVDHVTDLDPDNLHEQRPPRTLTQWTHFAPGIELEAEGPLRHHGTLKAGRPISISHISTNSALTTELSQGVEPPAIQGWISEDYRKMTPANVVAARQPHKGHSLLASVVALGKRPCPIAIRTATPDGIDKVVISAAGRDLVLIPDDGTRAPRLRAGPLSKPADA